MSVRVETKSGIVQGFEENGIRKWYGIPYAKPPINELRFKKPQAVEKWEGVLETKKFSAKCPQVPIPIVEDNGILQDENCLYLNIWAPNKNTNKLPVIFWIYGGAFASGEGSSDVYYGDSFAKNGVILVTFNYRVGIFGGFYNFKSKDELQSDYELNTGIFDVIEALKWVNENIESFGGDKDNITIMGESAGATIACLLLHYEKARGLFHKAIIESIADLKFHNETESFVTDKLLGILGKKREEISKVFKNSTEELYNAQLTLSGSNAMAAMCSPVLDGEMVKGQLIDIINQEESCDVKLLIGTNHDEGIVFVDKKEKWDEKTKMKMFNLIQLKSENEVNKISEKYYNFPNISSRAQMITDRMFVLPTAHLAIKQSKKENVFLYRFDFAPIIAKMVSIKAFHSAELIYVFNTLNSSSGKIIKGSKKKAQKVSGEMHKSWIEFAKNDNPGWKYYKENEESFMSFGNKSSEKVGYLKKVINIWNKKA